MRRSKQKDPSNSTQNAPNLPEFDIQGEIVSLKTRIARLEARILDDDDYEIPAGFGPGTTERERAPQTKHSSGIYRDRDMFVRFFEQYWPEIESLCGPKPNIRSLRLFFSSFPIEEFGQIGETAQKLLDRIGYLETFLTDPKLRARFRDDPRVLAGALAGVPNVGLWRSLKLCPPRTCKLQMYERAMRSYIKRKHPDVHHRLLASTDILHVTAWWKEYRTRDKILKRYRAVDLIRAWQAANPRRHLRRDRLECRVKITSQNGTN